LKIVKENLNVD